MAEGDAVFGPEDDTRVPGELLVILSRDANQTVSASIPAAGSPGDDVTALGVATIDDALSSLQPVAILRLHEEVAGVTAVADGSGPDAANALADEMEATYLVKYNPENDPSTAISTLTSLPEVVDAEPNYFAWTQFIPDDTDWAQQWGPATIHCPEAWDVLTGDPSVTVAIVDTGVDRSHPDLAAQLLAGYNFVDIHGPAPAGWQYQGRITPADNNPQDEVGHGTHVAGTIGAIGNNATGVAGVVWQCRLLPVRVMARMVRISDGRVSGSGTAANIATGVRWAADQNAWIINMSLGGYGNSRVQRTAIAYAQARGTMVVAAMGNDNTTKASYPAAYPGVVAVGAIDSNDHRANFSNTGPHISVCAPGVAIHSTYLPGTYANLSGTSMATPHVAGVAALAWSANTANNAVAVAGILAATARPLVDNPGDPVPNTAYGSGCVDAFGAVRAIVPAGAGAGGGQPISGPDPESNPDPDPNVVASTDQPANNDPADAPA
jgi:subtilisin family serine protease